MHYSGFLVIQLACNSLACWKHVQLLACRKHMPEGQGSKMGHGFVAADVCLFQYLPLQTFFIMLATPAPCFKLDLWHYNALWTLTSVRLRPRISGTRARRARDVGRAQSQKGVLGIELVD
eukprot:1156043-Pelagomonas_calceolata.AAC.30